MDIQMALAVFIGIRFHFCCGQLQKQTPVSTIKGKTCNLFPLREMGASASAIWCLLELLGHRLN